MQESESLTGLLDLEILLHGKFAHRTGVRVTANRSPRYHPAYNWRTGYQVLWSSRRFPLKGAGGRWRALEGTESAVFLSVWAKTGGLGNVTPLPVCPAYRYRVVACDS